MATGCCLAALLLTSAALGQAPGFANAAAAPRSPRGCHIWRPNPAGRWRSTPATPPTLYQPQLESWDGCKLSARITVRADAGKDKLQAQFGVLTVNGRHGRRWRGVRAAGPVNTGDIYSHSGVIGRRLQRVDRQRVGEPGRGFVQLT